MNIAEERRQQKMKYRGLTYDSKSKKYKYVYGMPSYGFETEEITEIGTPYGDFCEINPITLGEETKYRDRHGKHIYTGDIVTLEVDGELREFVVEKATVDREYNVLPGFSGTTVKVRLSDVVVFRWTSPDGMTHKLLPCVNEAGVADTFFMEIIDTIHERAVRESESKGEKL